MAPKTVQLINIYSTQIYDPRLTLRVSQEAKIALRRKKQLKLAPFGFNLVIILSIQLMLIQNHIIFQVLFQISLIGSFEMSPWPPKLGTGGLYLENGHQIPPSLNLRLLLHHVPLIEKALICIQPWLYHLPWKFQGLFVNDSPACPHHRLRRLPSPPQLTSRVFAHAKDHSNRLTIIKQGLLQAPEAFKLRKIWEDDRRGNPNGRNGVPVTGYGLEGTALPCLGSPGAGTSG